MKLVLASSSPRRRDLLRAAGFRFARLSPEVAEAREAGETPGEAVERLAREKAEAVAAMRPQAVVVGADTAVVLEGAFLGKPADRAEAGRMLRSLSGRSHEVMTGYALARGEEVRSAVCVTRVEFRELSEVEIQRYVAGGEPLDKAGGYGIQGGAAHMVRRVEGSYTNVVGLPMAEVTEWLREAGMDPA